MKILIAGDFVPRRRTAAQIEKGDFSCLEEVKTIIQSVDYAIVNFESPVVMREAKPIEKTGPSLRCTEKAMECVAQAGFNCVTLANNHFRDYGQVGVEDTISACEKFHVDHVGGDRTLVEARQTLYKSICGQTLAVINCCEHEWSIVSENHGGSNPLNIIIISRAIQDAKKNADYVLLIVHGGTEHYNLPTPRMKETYRFFIEQGADAVINHHQHCYSGYEVYQGKPIFYGLGNFCFDKAKAENNKAWEEGYLVELWIEDKIDFRLYTYVQCEENHPFVQMMERTTDFDVKIEKLNQIILDDGQLLDYYQKNARKGEVIVKRILAPYTIGVFEKLFAKGLLPSFVNDKRVKQLLAHIQCESHYDILLHGLKEQFKH